MAEEKKITSRDRLKNRYMQRNPDLDFETEGAVDLDAMAADELDQFDSDNNARREFDDKMNKLWGSDSRASKIFVGWANGEDPIENLLEMYGQDFLDALQSPEGKEKFKEALKKWRTGKDAEAEHQKVYDSNIQQTAKNLIDFADKHGLDDDAVKSLCEKAHEFGASVLDGLYTPEILEMVYKAGNYEKDMETAREEGRVAGKDENIVRELRTSGKTPTGLPRTGGTQNATSSEATAAKPKQSSFSPLGGIPIKRN